MLVAEWKEISRNENEMEVKLGGEENFGKDK